MDQHSSSTTPTTLNDLLLFSSQPTEERAWSDFQNAIFHFGVNCQENLLIQAVAGSGKSTTLFELAKRLRGKTIFLAFNVRIAEYAKGKMAGSPNVECRTFHSLGIQLIQKAVGFFPKKDDKAFGKGKVAVYFDRLPMFNDASRRRRGEFYGKFIARKIVKLIRQLGMMSYDFGDIAEFIRNTPGIFSIDPRKRAEEETWVYANIYLFPLWLRELDRLPTRPSKNKSGKEINTIETVIDFDDMVRLPCIHNLAEKYFFGIDNVLVDESQDMNPYQIHLITQIHTVGVRCICCGDRLQSIYAFRGAFMDAMDRIKTTTCAEELPLSVTYRSRREIVDYVNSMIPESTMIAHKDGGEVVSVLKKDFVQAILDHNVKMVVGAKNRSLVECWITLAKHKISSTLKGSGIVKSIRDIIKEFNPHDINDLLYQIRDSLAGAIEVDEAGEKTYKIPETLVELMQTIPELIETYDITTLQSLEDILTNMEADAFRELHTVHSAKGLEAPVVMVLNDWFPNNQLTNMQYVAWTRAEDKLLLVLDWFKEKERDSRLG